jgi:hypothetical protein
MSDEPKKWSRKRIWWALVKVFVLYPLSMGPACWVTKRIVEPTPFIMAYAPIGLLCCCFEPVGRAFDWYLSFWH